jgi:hypothetical protein
MLAIGRIANAAEKKIKGTGIPCTCSRITAMGMKTKNQFIEGFMERRIIVTPLKNEMATNGEVRSQ